MKVLLIDRSNSNKIISSFNTKKAAREWLRRKFNETNTNETWNEYKENFFFISPSDKYKDAKASKYGNDVEPVELLEEAMYLSELPDDSWEYQWRV